MKRPERNQANAPAPDDSKLGEDGVNRGRGRARRLSQAPRHPNQLVTPASNSERLRSTSVGVETAARFLEGRASALCVDGVVTVRGFPPDSVQPPRAYVGKRRRPWISAWLRIVASSSSRATTTTLFQTPR
jgi:hypothetical protein